MSKYTKGPWEVHSGYLIRKTDGEAATPIAELRVPYRRGVGVVRGMREEHANAALIAAAPELAEALVACAEQLAMCLGPNTEAGIRARAALRKAGIE